MIDAAGLADPSTSRSTAASARQTVAGAAAAGANVLVAGSALFRDPDGLEHAVQRAARPRHRCDLRRLTMPVPVIKMTDMVDFSGAGADG